MEPFLFNFDSNNVKVSTDRGESSTSGSGVLSLISSLLARIRVVCIMGLGGWVGCTECTASYSLLCKSLNSFEPLKVRHTARALSSLGSCIMDFGVSVNGCNSLVAFCTSFMIADTFSLGVLPINTNVTWRFSRGVKRRLSVCFDKRW